MLLGRKPGMYIFRVVIITPLLFLQQITLLMRQCTPVQGYVTEQASKWQFFDNNVF